MHNVWLIAKREYLERIHAKSFLIMTILIPILMGGLVYGAALANGRSGNLHIAVVTQDPRFGADLKSELESAKPSGSNSDRSSNRDNTNQSVSKVDIISPPAADTRATLDNRLQRPRASTATSGSLRPPLPIRGRPSSGSPNPRPTSSLPPCSAQAFAPPSPAKASATWACRHPKSTRCSNPSISSPATRAPPSPASTRSSSSCTSSSSSTE